MSGDKLWKLKCVPMLGMPQDPSKIRPYFTLEESAYVEMFRNVKKSSLKLNLIKTNGLKSLATTSASLISTHW